MAGTAILPFVYSVLGLVVGTLCIAMGFRLLLHHQRGNTRWTFNVCGFLKIDLFTAFPGIVLIVTGAIIIYITRFPGGP